MAEGILRHWLTRDLVPNVEVSSAGTYAQEGFPASAHGVTIAAEEGIDVSGHSSRLLHRDLIAKADLVFAMEANHLYEILRLCPGAEAKSHLLGGYAASGEDFAIDMAIFDPIGGDIEDYSRSYAIIEGHLERSYVAIREEISLAGRPRTEGETADE